MRAQNFSNGWVLKSVHTKTFCFTNGNTVPGIVCACKFSAAQPIIGYHLETRHLAVKLAK